MNYKNLVAQIKLKKSFLCVGLDTDIEKIPQHLLKLEDPIFEFNKQIIDATKDLCVAYKPNIAFYESMGVAGWESLRKTIEYIPNDIFTIADAKRGDIGNTSKMYAKTFFDTYNFDSVTVAPYMGEDSVTPFLDSDNYRNDNKWVILLVLTSNKGGQDFQLLGDEERLFESVVKKANTWANHEQMMFVVGATRGETIGEVRKIAPKNFFLVPGVGAQGGSLEDVCKFGLTEDCGLLVNSSRGIIYAGNDNNFAFAAKESAFKLQQQMEKVLIDNKII